MIRVSEVILHFRAYQIKRDNYYDDISFRDKQDIAMAPNNVIFFADNQFRSRYLGRKIWGDNFSEKALENKIIS